MKLFLFEIKKIIRTKSLFLILSLTCLLISILFIHNLMKQDLIQSEKLEHFSEISRELSTNILADREYLNEADDPAVSNRIDIGINLQQELSILIDSIRKNDWKQELESEVFVYHLAETYKNVQGDFKITTIEMEKIIKLNEELLISDLPKESERASIQPAVFMKQMISLFINTFGFLIFFVIFLPFLSKEFEDNHMKWLYTTPAPRYQLFLHKYVSIILSGVIWLLTLFGLSYGLPTLFGKNVDNAFQYPLFTTSEDFIYISDYILQAGIYSFGLMLFGTSVLLLITLFIRHTVLSTIIVVSTFFWHYILLKNNTYSLLNPFTYVEVDSIILENPHYFPWGAVVLFLGTMLLVSTSLLINHKRGI